MSTPETPRTWLLGKWLNGPHRGETMALGGPVPDTPVRAVEKALVDAERERLLDLLENWLRPASAKRLIDPLGAVESQTDAVLREYGRLGTEES